MTKYQTEYHRKLKDPRWQKKRLAILERDEWRCRMCGDDENTLHVHHRYYSNGEPWEIDDKALVTLCADCHEVETDSLKDVYGRLRVVLSECGGFAHDVEKLIEALVPTAQSDKPFIEPEWDVLGDVVKKLLNDRLDGGKQWDAAWDEFFEELRERVKRRGDNAAS